MRLILAAACVLLTAYTGAWAQTIYPLNRAEILAGAKFDLKVEFPGAPAADTVKVTINGKPAAEVLGLAPNVLVKEEGQDQTAFWIKDAAITAPGTYTVEATMAGKSAKVTWEVFGTRARRARNVILFIGDGMSVAHRTAARILSKGIAEGRYGGELAMDDMPFMALVSTAGTDSVITDSANSMSAYTTGHKSCTNALGVYCARNVDNLGHPRVEPITTIVKRRHRMAVGVVTNTEIEDATPAGMVAQTRRRSDFNDIVKMFYAAQPEVMMGGGSPNFLPKSTPGSKRTDEDDYIKKFESAGYKFVTTSAEMLKAAGETGTRRLLGLFNTANLDGALDRRILKKGSVAQFPDQPDLVQQTKAAIDILSRNPNGFMLMVESGRIDKYGHSLDWERSVYDTIMLDNAVKAAKAWAGTRGDTLIVVVPDHAHMTGLVGVYDDALPGQLPRDKLGIYEGAGFPAYPAPDADGYPTQVDVSRRLAFHFGAYPDHCFTGKPSLTGEFVPALPGPDGKTPIANPAFCPPGAARITGNLPFSNRNMPVTQGVHSGEDVVLTAMGPGAEQFRGRIDNTRVFRIIANSLGLAGRK